MESYVLSSLVEVVCCDINIRFTQLTGSCLVVGLLFFGVFGALFNVLCRSVVLFFVGDHCMKL
jgi:hypothetical protein